ncbi:hypothetical protein P3L10_019234 [Capsicum annuum]
MEKRLRSFWKQLILGMLSYSRKVDNGKGLAATVADVKDANKRGALIFATRECKTDLCKYSVKELKIDVNEKDEKDYTVKLFVEHETTARLRDSQFIFPQRPCIGILLALCYCLLQLPCS